MAVRRFKNFEEYYSLVRGTQEEFKPKEVKEEPKKKEVKEEKEDK